MNQLTGENTAIILFFIGIFGLVARRNILQSIISIGIMDVAAVLFYLTLNADAGAVPPISPGDAVNIADPLPQALMITAIVIGVAVTAISLVMFINLYHKYGTTDWDRAREKRMEHTS